MHIGVKEILLEDLGEKNFDAEVSKLFHVHVLVFQVLNIGCTDTIDPLKHQNIGSGVVPVDFGHVKLARMVPVLFQFHPIRCFKVQIELIENGSLVILYDVYGM